MKNIKILFSAIALLFLMPSCSDKFLERLNPNEQPSSTFWKTEENLQQGLYAAYRPLRFNGCYSRWLHVLYVSRSDEGYSTSPNPYFQSYSNFLVGSYNDDNAEGVFYPWLDLYKGIFWANQVKDNAPNTETDDDLKNRIISEAYFLRGLHFLNIAGIYGRGPLALTSFASEQSAIGEQPDLYARARADFQEAAKYLPAYYTENNDLGRATLGSALGMLAKVYAQEKNWTKVEEICREIFALKNQSGQPLYQLVSKYEDNFTDQNENNSESLFEVQYADGVEAGVELGCNRAKFLGLPVDGAAWDDATARNIIKTDLEKEKTVDGKVDPRLKQTLFYFDPDNPGELFYGKTWTAWNLNKNKVYWKKYSNNYRRNFEDYNSGINFRVLRLADIYLLYAEALNELGRTSEAYAYINKVRARVNLPNLENSTVFTGIGNDQAKMRKQIMHERVCELTSEAWRWFDLERWGMFETAENISFLKSRDDDFENFTIGTNNRFPIPYREIPLIKGIKQNPGY